jgi:hypothetical protein
LTCGRIESRRHRACVVLEVATQDLDLEVKRTARKEDEVSRIPLVEPENASPEVRALYAKLEEGGFEVMNVMKMFANNHHFLAGLYAFASGLYFHGKLSPRYRELAYLRASQLNSCHY